jgi:RimJ/RimL family protein N-acetyltransferase
VEIGNTLYAPRVRRTGLNTEAKQMLLGHAFEVLGVHCVQIRTDALNHTSRRAIERIGAKQDGILRGHQVMHDPDYGERRRDTVVYSILDIEWPGIRRHLDALLDR